MAIALILIGQFCVDTAKKFAFDQQFCVDTAKKKLIDGKQALSSRDRIKRDQKCLILI